MEVADEGAATGEDVVAVPAVPVELLAAVAPPGALDALGDAAGVVGEDQRRAARACLREADLLVDGRPVGVLAEVADVLAAATVALVGWDAGDDAVRRVVVAAHDAAVLLRADPAVDPAGCVDLLLVTPQVAVGLLVLALDPDERAAGRSDGGAHTVAVQDVDPFVGPVLRRSHWLRSTDADVERGTALTLLDTAAGLHAVVALDDGRVRVARLGEAGVVRLAAELLGARAAAAA